MKNTKNALLVVAAAMGFVLVISAAICVIVLPMTLMMDTFLPTPPSEGGHYGVLEWLGVIGIAFGWIMVLAITVGVIADIVTTRKEGNDA